MTNVIPVEATFRVSERCGNSKKLLSLKYWFFLHFNTTTLMEFKILKFNQSKKKHSAYFEK